ncbi:unnamed protein product, partial [Staurois parvus]
WGPRAIGVHGAPVSLPKLKKAYEKERQYNPFNIISNGTYSHLHVFTQCVFWKGTGGLTTYRAPGNRGSWGPCVLAQTQKSL